jgi:hypothetical protein
MRMPRVRFTGRLMIVGMALSAALVALTLLVQRSSEAAHREVCASNLRQIGLGLMQYSVSHDSFPAGTVVNDRLPPERRLSWLTVIINYIEYTGLLLEYSQPWDSDTNRFTRVRGKEDATTRPVGKLSFLTCPAAPGSADEHMPGWTWYVGIAGVGQDAPTLPNGHPRAGVLGYDRRTRPRDITDGASNTLLVAETGIANGPWTAGGPATLRGLDPGRQPYVGRGRQFGGTHRGGVMVALGDGSVRFLHETINPKVFEALATVAGAEPLPAVWDQ